MNNDEEREPMKMRFEYQWDADSPRIVVELPAYATLSDVVEAFNGFLRASGYVFDGQLTIQEAEEDEIDNA